MEEVINLFNSLNIEYKLVRHEAIFTGKDEEKVKNIDFGGEICKNLFLKDIKNKCFYLVSMPINKRADLKKIAKELDSNRLTFGNEEELWENLHIRPGSVSMLNVIRAPETEVIFVLDKELKNIDRVSFHPNDNTASIAFDTQNITKILDNYGKKYMFLEVEA